MKKRSNKTLYYLLILLLLGMGILYILNSKHFEQNPPGISMQESYHWNLKEPIEAVIEDDAGIKNYKIFMNENGNKTLIASETLSTPQKRKTIKIEPPRTGMFLKKGELSYEIEVTDTSKWNMLEGNSARASAKVYIDKKAPQVEIVSSSYKINKGGSALVVFYANDANLKSLRIENNGRELAPFPFYKPGYYAALVAWSVKDEQFKARIRADDYAGNSVARNVNFFLKDKRYRESTITLKDSFIEGKIKELTAEVGGDMEAFAKQQDMFVFINEKIRGDNEKRIYEAGANLDFTKDAQGFAITPFYPLANSAAVASFGDHRIYRYGGNVISESYHMGLDLASVKNAKVQTSTPGEVIFSDFNGIYGNSVILHHGLGLSTLYSHCSEVYAHKGEFINAGDVVAKTGATGLALGDHLHFGVLVQGAAVRPEEWMDKQWIKLNINNILDDAKALIDSRGEA